MTLTLPRTAASIAPAERVAAQAPAASGPLRVLVVEDNRQVAELAVQPLSEAGHAVTHAPGAAAALERLDAGEAADVMVSDLLMPGDIDALGLARAVRKRWTLLPIVLGTGDSGSATHAVRDGFPPLAKPFRPEQLHDAIGAELAAVGERGKIVPLRQRGLEGSGGAASG